MIRAATRRRLLRFRLRGDAVRCPCCDGRFARFADAPNRANAICPRCGSQERHRLLRLWLEQAAAPAGRVLHFAPEHALTGWIAGRPQVSSYTTSDFPAGSADLSLDVTAMELPDASFDWILISHVLEHVEAETAALAEIARVLAPGGTALVMLPVELTREHTLEDPAITTPEQRLAAYLQHDHVRLYGRDVAERLAAGGMTVETVRPAGALDPVRHVLLLSDEIYLLRHGTP